MGLCKLIAGKTHGIQVQISLSAISCTMNLSQKCLGNWNLHKVILLLTGILGAQTVSAGKCRLNCMERDNVLWEHDGFSERGLAVSCFSPGFVLQEVSYYNISVVKRRLYKSVTSKNSNVLGFRTENYLRSYAALFLLQVLEQDCKQRAWHIINQTLEDVLT